MLGRCRTVIILFVEYEARCIKFKVRQGGKIIPAQRGKTVVITTRLCFALLLFLMLWLFCSCAYDVANRYYGKTKYPAKKSNEVELLSTPPNRPYEVIADFQSRGESPEDMRHKAADVGADAVIVSILGGYVSRGDEWAGSDSYSHTYSRIAGTAIMYRQGNIKEER